MDPGAKAEINRIMNQLAVVRWLYDKYSYLIAHDYFVYCLARRGKTYFNQFVVGGEVLVESLERDYVRWLDNASTARDRCRQHLLQQYDATNVLDFMLLEETFGGPSVWLAKVGPIGDTLSPFESSLLQETYDRWGRKYL